MVVAGLGAAAQCAGRTCGPVLVPTAVVTAFNQATASISDAGGSAVLHEAESAASRLLEQHSGEADGLLHPHIEHHEQHHDSVAFSDASSFFQEGKPRRCLAAADNESRLGAADHKQHSAAGASSFLDAPVRSSFEAPIHHAPERIDHAGFLEAPGAAIQNGSARFVSPVHSTADTAAPPLAHVNPIAQGGSTAASFLDSQQVFTPAQLAQRQAQLRVALGISASTFAGSFAVFTKLVVSLARKHMEAEDDDEEEDENEEDEGDAGIQGRRLQEADAGAGLKVTVAPRCALNKIESIEPEKVKEPAQKDDERATQPDELLAYY
eukprot:gnl/TRDRNA2_/TRDRNA2_54178_c0_seq1.p1 gnl/TRDRNA2_/TRDRNA2_54178_c0~~gnl/TRDRNA2_/TRDRNA2_54178_c0_seq1.p1  ORF type:complete len:335 (+),score=66.04 gnl/TRDRNA2_/TRDRNA2_54178_c0_seq1:38-1006(+)